MTATNVEIKSTIKAIDPPVKEDVTKLQLADYFKRPYLVASYSITTSNGTKQNIFTLWKARVLKKLAGYKYFRGNPVVTLKYTGNPTLSGTILFYFYPTVQLTTADYASGGTGPLAFTATNYDFVPQVMQFPHIKIELENYTTKQLKLPYVDNVPFGEISNYTDWDFSFVIMNSPELNSQATPDAVTIDMYVSYDDVELYAAVASEGFEMSNGFVSKGLYYISDILTSVSSVFPIVTPYQMMAGAAGKIAESMGFSRALQVAHDAFVWSSNSTLTYMSGQPDFSDKLSVDPRVCLDVSGGRLPLSHENDTDIYYLMKKYCMVYRSRGASSHAVLPSHAPQATIGATTYYVPSTLAFVSGAFKYWRGTIKYKIEFVANSLLRQRYAIYLVPPYESIPTTYVLGTGYVTHLVDICGRTEYEFEVPYVYTSYYQDQMSLNSRRLDTTVWRIAIVPVGFAQGYTGTPLNIRWNLYVAAGDDFEVAVPSYELNQGKVLYEGSDGVLLEGNEYNSAIFGEKITNINVLTRRPCYLGNISTGNTSGTTTLFYPIYGLNGNTTTSSVPEQARTFANYFGSMYLSVTGGSRLKIYDPTTDVSSFSYATSTERTLQGLYVDDSVLRTGRGLSVNDKFLKEVELPSQTPSLYTFARRYYTGIRAPSKVADSFAVLDFAKVVNSKSYMMSGADDFVFHGFLGCPAFT